MPDPLCSVMIPWLSPCLLFSVLDVLCRCPQLLVMFRLISAMLICLSSLQFLLRILLSPSLQFSVLWVLTVQVLFHQRREFPVLGIVCVCLMVGQLLSQLLSHLFLPPAVVLLQLAPLALFPLLAFLAQFALLSLLPARSLMLLFNLPSCLPLIQCAVRSGFAVSAARCINLIKPNVVICVFAAFAIALHTFAMELPLTPAWAFTIICRRTVAPPSPCIIWVLWSACALIVTPNFSPARLLTVWPIPDETSRSPNLGACSGGPRTGSC